MDFYKLKVGSLNRQFPIVSLGPKIKVASVNLLGDRELVELLARSLAKRFIDIKFDYLVGPEVKVVPLLQELSRILKKDRYIVCRKEIHGYMKSPLKLAGKQGLVLDGPDAALIKGKKVVVVDDVVSSGRTLLEVDALMKQASSTIVARASAFKQGEKVSVDIPNLIYLFELPVFTS